MNKLFNTLLLIVLISCSFAKLNTNANKYSLAIYGDNGQVEFWYKNMIRKNLTPDEISAFYKNVLNKETYDVKAFQCTVTVDGKKTDLTQKDGLENFNHILENKDAAKMLRDADGAVFIGDVVYLETKRLAQSKEETVNGAKITQYKLDEVERWETRLNCGWNLFFNSLLKAGVAQKETMKSKLKGKPSIDFVVLDKKIQLLAGNQSQDFDLFKEENQVKSIVFKDITSNESKFEVNSHSDSEEVFSGSPKFITITYKDFAIEFLDFNSANLACLTNETASDYSKCTGSPRTLTLTQARTYAWRVKKYIKKFTFKLDKNGKETKRVWRVMRAHNPPLNTEDGDAHFYFKDILIQNPQKKIGKRVNIWKLMKNFRVNIFLGSHTNAAEVAALPYNYAFKALNTKDCDTKTAFGCYAVDPKNPFLSGATYKANCEDNVTFKLPINPKYDIDNDMLYVFIFRNSGRVLDALKAGKNSIGVRLWSRAKEYTVGANKMLGYGFAMADFTKDSVKVTFYENTPDQKNQLVTAAAFEVAEGSLPNMANVAKFIDGKICPAKH